MSDFKAKMHQIRFRWGSAQTPLGELTVLPQVLYLYLRGLLLRGGTGEERKKMEGGGKGKRGRGGRGGREGEGNGFAEPMSYCFLAPVT